MLVYRDREKFSPVSEAGVKRAFEPLNPLGLEPLTLGQEGFKVRLWNGRIDCLLGGVHIWCEITPDVLQTLQWLLANAYGLAYRSGILCVSDHFTAGHRGRLYLY